MDTQTVSILAEIPEATRNRLKRFIDSHKLETWDDLVAKAIESYLSAIETLEAADGTNENQ